MTILIDSDHLSVLVDSRDARHERLAGRLAGVHDQIALPVVAMEEHLRGWLAQIQRIRDPAKLTAPYGRLTQLVTFFGQWEIAGWTAEAAAEFSRLRASRVRIGTQDLRIESIALSVDALLLSANLRDFGKVPGIEVEVWLHA
jgi:tRNA(fMet)-specific endonuclease VapC